MSTFLNVKTFMPINTAKFKGLNLVVTLPAAFSATCTKECVPDILGNLNKIKEAGVKNVYLVCSDQPFAVKEWIKFSQWGDADVIFCSDYGTFHMREVVGKVSEEKLKKFLPRALGDLLRRGYVVYKDGEMVGKYVESNSINFTLKVDEMIAGIKALAGNTAA